MAAKKSTKPARPPMAYPSGTYITIKQVMEIAQVGSPKTVHDWINEGLLPAYRWNDKPGSAIRIVVDDVYAMMTPVIPEAVMADIRSRQPAGSPLHVPATGTEGGAA